MITLKLNKGSVLIDDEDLCKINGYSWFINKRGYAASSIWIKKSKKVKQIRMHRLIMGINEKQNIDHIDRNKLNNQKINLRFIPQRLNVFNRSKPKNNKSGFTGVFWDRLAGKWRAYISVRNKRIDLGHFSNINLAIKKRKIAEELYHVI